MKCPDCSHKASKAIYAGIPAKLCLNENCHYLWGVGSLLIAAICWVVPFSGSIYIYEGGYLPALLDWWKCSGD